MLFRNLLKGLLEFTEGIIVWGMLYLNVIVNKNQACIRVRGPNAMEPRLPGSFSGDLSTQCSEYC